jgi:hypothetical protein
MVEGYEPRDTPVAFYKSRDGGRNWEKMPKPSGIGAGQQGYCVMLGAHPTDSLKIVAGGVKIAQSNDGGRTWVRKITGHADHHGFAFYPKTQTDFVVSTDGGMYRYAWSDSAVKANLNHGYRVTQFYAGNYGISGVASISGSQDNGTQVANGMLKTQRFFGADGAYSHIGLQDGSVAYFSTQDTGIRRISNFDPSVVPKNTQIKKILDQRFKTDGVDFINAYTRRSETVVLPHQQVCLPQFKRRRQLGQTHQHSQWNEGFRYKRGNKPGTLYWGCFCPTVQNRSGSHLTGRS